MPYNNIAEFVTAIGTVVVRRGAANDWAAYLLGANDDAQSGSLTRLSKGECDKYGITASITAVWPELRYRP